MKYSCTVSGLHCASCDVRIRAVCKKHTCSCADEQKTPYELCIRADAKDSYTQCINEILALGYHVDEHHNTQSTHSGFAAQKKGRRRAHRLFIVTRLFVSSIFFFFLIAWTQSARHTAIPAGNTRQTAILLGLIASCSTCLAVTGGIVLGYSAHTAGASVWGTQLLFHLGRIGGFLLVGALLGAIGSTIQPGIVGTIVLQGFVALLLFAIGLQGLGILPPRSVIMPGQKNLAQYAFLWNSTKVAPLVGAITVLLPCGFTQGMQIIALTTGSPREGAMLMGAFAIGTMPVLIGIGLGSQRWNKTQIAGYVMASLLIAFGIFQGYNTSMLFHARKSSESIGIDVLGAAEIEIYNVGHDGVSFIPSRIELTQGKIYDVVVTPTNDGQGCMGSVVYGGTVYPIKKGQSFTLRVNADRPRTIPLTCASMGMGMGEIVIGG